MPSNQTVVKVENRTGFLTFNTTTAGIFNLTLRVNSMNGKKPYDLPLQVIIVEKAKYDFNAKPFLTDPPTGINLVIDPK